MELSFLISESDKSSIKKNTAKNQLVNFVENTSNKAIMKLVNANNDNAKKLSLFYQTISSLDEETVEKSFNQIKKYSTNIFKQYDKFEEFGFLGSKELKQSFENLTKELFKCEARLHKAFYKNKPVQKTDLDLLEGLRKMNAANLSNLLDVE